MLCGVLELFDYLWGQGARLPIFLVSSEYLCKCGCGGKHSLEPLYQVILWSLRFGALGKAPTRRHDLSPFSQQDSERSARMGQKLGWRLLLLWLSPE